MASSLATVYRSTDPGAPVLTGQPGSMVAVFNAVLVDGYGDKSGAGWDKITFADTPANCGIWRNSQSTGTGSYVQLTETVAAQRVFLRCYSNMTGYNTGSDQTPPVNAEGASQTQAIIGKSKFGLTPPQPWIIIANDRSMYIFTHWFDSANKIGWTPYFIGDFEQFPDGALGNFAISVGAPGQENFDTGWSAGNQSLFVPSEISRETDQDQRGRPTGNFVMIPKRPNSSENQNTYKRFNQYAVAAGLGGNVTVGSDRSYGPGNVIDRIHGGYNFSKIFMVEAPRGFRGAMPGVLTPMHDKPFADNSMVNYVEGIGASEWIALVVNAGEPDTATGDGQVIIRLDAPWL